jgi:hypothetical protein
MALHWFALGACCSAPTTSGSPTVHPVGLEHGVVLATVKVWPGDGGANLGVGGRPTLTASARAAVGLPCRNEQLRDARHRDA